MGTKRGFETDSPVSLKVAKCQLRDDVNSILDSKSKQASLEDEDQIIPEGFWELDDDINMVFGSEPTKEQPCNVSDDSGETWAEYFDEITAFTKENFDSIYVIPTEASKTDTVHLGPGGTGKTEVLIKLAKKKLAAGEFVAVIAYTAMACRSIAERMENFLENVWWLQRVVFGPHTYHSYMAINNATACSALEKLNKREGGFNSKDFTFDEKGASTLREEIGFGLTKFSVNPKPQHAPYLTGTLLVDEASMLTKPMVELLYDRLTIEGVRTATCHWFGDIRQLSCVVANKTTSCCDNIFFSERSKSMKLFYYNVFFRQRQGWWNNFFKALAEAKVTQEMRLKFIDCCFVPKPFAKNFSFVPCAMRLFNSNEEVSTYNDSICDAINFNQDKNIVKLSTRVSPTFDDATVIKEEICTAKKIIETRKKISSDKLRLTAEKLCVGCSVCLTHNINKEMGLVNGTSGTFLGTDKEGKMMRCLIGNQEHLIPEVSIEYWLDKRSHQRREMFKKFDSNPHPKVARIELFFYPLRPHYAQSAHKAQGCGFESLLVSNSPNNSGPLVYTALTRFQTDSIEDPTSLRKDKTKPIGSSNIIDGLFDDQAFTAKKVSDEKDKLLNRLFLTHVPDLNSLIHPLVLKKLKECKNQWLSWVVSQMLRRGVQSKKDRLISIGV